MRISSKDMYLLQSHLYGADMNGHDWLVYDSKQPNFQIEESFKQKDEAILYCLDQSTDIKSFSIAPKGPVMDAVYRAKDLLEVSVQQGTPVSLPFDVPQLIAQHENIEQFKASNMEQNNNAASQQSTNSTEKDNTVAQAGINVYNIEKLQLHLQEKFGPEKAEAVLKNINYLTKQLEKTGFKEIHREDLVKNVLDEKPNFQLVLQNKYGTDEAKATLNFNHSDKGNYFFNSYDLAIKNEGAAEEFKQRFKVNYGNTFSLKEAFNLMQGRSVFKQFIKVDPENKENNQKYKAWATMDFKNTDNNGNYKITKSYRLKVEEALAQYPIKELLNEQQKTELVDSIHRGNYQKFTFSKDGVEEKMYVEASPLHNSLKFYDANMNKINLNIKIKAEENKVSAEQKVEAIGSKKKQEELNKSQEMRKKGPKVA